MLFQRIDLLVFWQAADWNISHFQHS